ncbi:sigma factor-like helix-turn-helix DNA-binding protein [Nocardioides acrostichi]
MTDPSTLMADSLGLALMVVLGSLEPEERPAFVLHDPLAVPFAEIAPILGKSSDAAKMSASRARLKVRGASPDAIPASRLYEQRRVVDAFLAAARDSDFEALLDILDPDLVWEIRTAEGVRVRSGAHHGLGAVARGDRTRITARRVLVDGQPGILAHATNGRPVALMRCTVAGDRMTTIVSIVDRNRLDAGLLNTRARQDPCQSDQRLQRLPQHARQGGCPGRRLQPDEHHDSADRRQLRRRQPQCAAARQSGVARRPRPDPAALRDQPASTRC